VAGLLFNTFKPSVEGNCASPDASVWTGAVATEGVTGIPSIDSSFAALDASPLLVPGVTPFLCPSVTVFGQQAQQIGNLFQGKEASGRVDYTPTSKDRFFVQYNWQQTRDMFGPCDPACTR